MILCDKKMLCITFTQKEKKKKNTPGENVSNKTADSGVSRGTSSQFVVSAPVLQPTGVIIIVCTPFYGMMLPNDLTTHFSKINGPEVQQHKIGCKLHFITCIFTLRTTF